MFSLHFNPRYCPGEIILHMLKLDANYGFYELFLNSVMCTIEHENSIIYSIQFMLIYILLPENHMYFTKKKGIRSFVS